jgi:hypothetical protein
MKRNNRCVLARYGIAIAALAGMFACGGASPAADASGLGATSANASNGPIDPAGTLTLALKFVEFTKDGKPVMTEAALAPVIAQINHLYSQCNLKVKLEEYVQVDPTQQGLTYEEGSMDVMDKIRAPFDTDKKLVVVDTGAWNHGNMGPANAWTAMPGQSPSGAVLEAPVADNGNIVAHELGHYLNLDHVSDQSNMMNPIIYDNSTTITASQCDQMRQTALSVRAQALRS